MAGEDHRGVQDRAGLIVERRHGRGNGWTDRRWAGARGGLGVGAWCRRWAARSTVSQQAALMVSNTTPSGARCAAGRVMVSVALVAATSEVRPTAQRASGRLLDDLPTSPTSIRRI